MLMLILKNLSIIHFKPLPNILCMLNSKLVPGCKISAYYLNIKQLFHL